VTPEQFPKPLAQQSQTIGNITITGGHNALAQTQAGGDVTLTQSSDHLSATNTDLQATLAAIAQLKQHIAASPALNPIEKATIEVPVKILEAELQKPHPDKSLVDQAIVALKKGLDGVITLAEPVTKVVTLIAKAWTGLL
jgi:cell envelope opacity-associated protein A